MFKQYPDVLTVQNVAHALGIGKNQAYELVRTRQIACIRVGRKYCIPKPCLIDYVLSARYKARSAAAGNSLSRKE